VVGSAQEQQAPYLNWLARRCGLASASYGITHPSLPNYLALVSGTTGGVVATCTPAACPQKAPTLFAQVRASGRQWKVYAESMTSNCQMTDTRLYAARHTGAPYYPAIATDCARNQVPMGTTTSGALVTDLAAGALPAFSLVVPNMCNIQHDCPVNTGDRWLQTLMPRILGGADYRSGNTLVLLSYDEGFGGTRGVNCRATLERSCHIVTVAIAHSVPRGLRTGVLFDHYAVLRATEDVLGLGRLGGAASSSVPSLRTAFRF
jgi:acid phosphatase